ncbi:MAG: insulinase family protein [Deltaproteobacteria bacterium]|nr:insulinase family protein [Deltaproteobacteria bacterium]
METKVERYTLKNGMRFLLLSRPGVPVFTGYIRVNVGGADEHQGQTGIAHMLEHMAFKGTSKIGTKNYSKEKPLLDEIEKLGVEIMELKKKKENSSNSTLLDLEKQQKALQKKEAGFIVKDEFSRLYLQNGASNFNATTSKDLTSYFVELPNSKLELWAYLESQRLKEPVFREFYKERDVVMEERRMRVEDSPFGKNYENLLGTAFENSPYKFPTIGYADEIALLTASDLKKFYDTYYVPQNMVGAVVGDIDLAKTKKILEEYFGKIPAGAKPPLPKNEMEIQTKEKRSLVKDAARSQLMMAYHKPTLPEKDDYVFDMIDQILCGGRTSRLYVVLVEKGHLASGVSCDPSTPGSRLSNLFWIYAAPLGKTSPQKLEQGIDEEISKMIKNGVSQEEMERAKNQLLSDRLFQLSSNLGLADLLSYFEVVAGDWHYLLEHEKAIEQISSTQIQQVAAKYFTPQNKTVSVLGH